MLIDVIGQGSGGWQAALGAVILVRRRGPGPDLGWHGRSLHERSGPVWPVAGGVRDRRRAALQQEAGRAGGRDGRFDDDDGVREP